MPSRLLDIVLHDKGIPRHERSADFRAVHFEILLPPFGFPAHLINAAHFRRHISGRVRLYAYDVLRIKIIYYLRPFAITAIRTNLCATSSVFICCPFGFGFTVDPKILTARPDYPPAIAPMIRNGSEPLAIGFGNGASGDSCDKSSPQAKNRTIGRRRCVT